MPHIAKNCKRYARILARVNNLPSVVARNKARNLLG